MYKLFLNGHQRPGFASSLARIYRHRLLALVVGNSLFSDEEQLLANHNAYECESPTRLALWLRRIRREARGRASVCGFTANAA